MEITNTLSTPTNNINKEDHLKTSTHPHLSPHRSSSHSNSITSTNTLLNLRTIPRLFPNSIRRRCSSSSRSTEASKPTLGPRALKNKTAVAWAAR